MALTALVFMLAPVIMVIGSGTADGSRWAGLNRRRFWATTSICRTDHCKNYRNKHRE